MKERKRLHELMEKESVDEVLQWYDECAKLYDENVTCGIFYFHQTILEATTEHVPQKNAIILDLGAGTGTMAEMLVKHGYTSIDAIDGSQSMLDVATEKKIYGKIVCDFIGTDPIKGLNEGAYDAIVSAGVFAHGAVYYESIPLILKYLKTGGYFIFEISALSMKVTPRLSKDSLMSMVADLEKEKLCKFIEEKETFHINKEPASVFILKKL